MGKTKKNGVRTAAVCALAALCGLGFAGEPSEKDGITLPDISTVVSGGESGVRSGAVPDYSDVLPDEAPSSEILPRLPDAVTQDAPGAGGGADPQGGGKKIYAEGIVGIGLPGFFTGNFSVCGQDSASPFRLDFGHEYLNGYARHEFSDGYFDRITSVSADKTLSADSAVWKLGGRYESSGDGFQGKCAEASGMTKELTEAAVSFDWKSPGGAKFGVSADGGLYRRFLDLAGSRPESVPDSAADAAAVLFRPRLLSGWERNGFSVSLAAEYTLEGDIKDVYPDSDVINRGLFTLGAGWKNQLVTLAGSVSALIGNEIGGHAALVPFSLAADFSVPVPISARSLSISLSGGLDSRLPTVSDLERNFKFSALSRLPSETSDWYGRAGVSVPVRDALTFGLSAEFRKTALENGVWEPDYDSPAAAGQYGYEQNGLTRMNTEAVFSARAGIAVFSASWKAFWIDVPAAETRNSLNVSVSVQGEDARWGADGGLAFSPDDGEDHAPDVGLSAFLKLTRAASLAVSADDVVKLISGESRIYAGKYIERSGHVGVLVKFFL